MDKVLAGSDNEVRSATTKMERLAGTTTPPGRGELEDGADGTLTKMEKRHNDDVEIAASRDVTVTSPTPVTSHVRTTTTTKMERGEHADDVSERVTTRLEHDERTSSSPEMVAVSYTHLTLPTKRIV